MIDLHSHSTASDGQHAPADVIERAARAGIQSLALTDHDTVDGIAEAHTAAANLGVELIAGIEISAHVGRQEVHILGHFVDATSPTLRDRCAAMRIERMTRMRRMVEKVQALGYPLQLSDVIALAGEANMARPHLARVMVERGFCGDMREAFNRYLGDGKAAYVPREKLDVADAIALIHAAGGAATLAHPGCSRMESNQIRILATQGLDGLEVFHPDQNPSLQEKLMGLSSELGLVPTSGSDFHGEAVAPGRALGDASMPRARLDALRARAESWRAKTA